MEVPRSADCLGQVVIIGDAEVGELEVELAVAHVPVQDNVGLDVSVIETIIVQAIRRPSTSVSRPFLRDHRGSHPR